MMKRIALVTVALVAAVGIGYGTHRDEFTPFAGMASQAALRMWERMEANPAPVCLALGTFLLTVIYHKARGKSLRESVEVAATRVTVVPAPSQSTGEDENAVVKRAKARATRTQLLTDQIGLENRYRKLPEAITKAEKEACYAEKALADAERLRADKRKVRDEVAAQLKALRKEKAAGEEEMAEIEAELQKMAALV